MKTSSNCLIDPEAIVAESAVFGDYVVVLKGAFIGENVKIQGFTQICENVHIEADVVLECGVVLQRSNSQDAGKTVFCRGCVIGAGAVIHQGITVGEGAFVKPGSVVEQNIPPFAIVSGFPAKVIGYVEKVDGSGMIEWHQQASFPGVYTSRPLGVGGVTLHRLKKIADPRGDLSFGEFLRDIPFEPKRYFLVFDVPSEKTRGEHAHRECHQFLICVKGNCAIVVDDGKSRCEVLLQSPDMGLYLPPLTWGIQYKYSSDAVLLVFTSDYYDAGDYIRDYSEFRALARS